MNPGQQVIKIVNEELIALMGSTQAQLTFSRKPPTVFMMVGLQGAGKTTTSGKLAGQLRKQGRSPLLVACDVYRPAAIKQLQVVGKNYNIPVFEMGTEVSPCLLYTSDIIIQDVKQRFYMVFRKILQSNRRKNGGKNEFYSNSLYWWSGDAVSYTHLRDKKLTTELMGEITKVIMDKVEELKVKE